MSVELEQTLRARRCCYCCKRIHRDDSQNWDDDTFIAFECEGGHTVYVPRPQITSDIVRVYVRGGVMRAEDALVRGEWVRTKSYEQSFAPFFEDVYDALTCHGYEPVLNHLHYNQYRYFRKERIEAMGRHWEERKAIEASLPIHESS